MRGGMILAAAVLCLAACAKPHPGFKNQYTDKNGRVHTVETIPAGNKKEAIMATPNKSAKTKRKPIEITRATKADWARYSRKDPDRPTLEELDLLRDQLSRCWSIQAGARYSKDLKVEVRVTVSPQRRILTAEIIDQWRFERDNYFRAAADSAIRALNSKECNPLELNPSKYDQWKDMIIEFDPSEFI